MKRTNGFLAVVFTTVSLSSMVFVGCGKDMKLGIKAAEAEKDQPSAALVRNVQVTYHTPAGHEEMRESIPVLGLSQPVSTRADLLKDLHVEKDGIFEARGYTSDGILVLRGQAFANPEQGEAVEIIMDREASQATTLGSPLLRRIRLANASTPREFVREAKDFRAESDNGRCVELPDLRLNPASGSHPKLIFEGAVKAPSFRVEVGIRVERGLFKALSGLVPVQINPAGDGELELGHRFLDGLLFKGPTSFIIRLHSNQYEGCLEIKTRPEPAPLRVVFSLGRGAGVDVMRHHPLSALGELSLLNPNDYTVSARVVGIMTSLATSERLQPCLHQNGDTVLFEKLRCAPTITETIEVPAHGRGGFAVFAGMSSKWDFFNRQLRIDWNVVSHPIFDASDLSEAVLVPSIIP